MQKPRLLILDSGGHARVLGEIFESSQLFEIAGFTSPNPTHRLFHYARLGDDSALPALRDAGISHAFAAFGSNRLRHRLLAHLRSLGFSLPNAISPHAILSPRLTLGHAIAIMASGVVNSSTVIDDGAILNTASSVDHDNHIGACAHIAPGSHLGGKVTVGEGAFLAAGVGAGAVIIRDVPPDSTVVGVPALRRLR
jgi:sugar O-acyltransferase (sialic acid O-acetyltransferase NeuD family)